MGSVRDDEEAEVASWGDIDRCGNSPQSPTEEQHEMVRIGDCESAEPDDAAEEDLINSNGIEKPERRRELRQILKTELRHTMYYFYNGKTGEPMLYYIAPQEKHLLQEAKHFLTYSAGMTAQLVSMINIERRLVADFVYRSRRNVRGRYAGYRYAAVTQANYLSEIAKEVWEDIAERPDGFVVRYNDEPYPANVAVDKHAAKVYGCLTYYMPIVGRCMGPGRLAEAIFHFWNNNGVARTKYPVGDKFTDFPCISEDEGYVADGTPASKIFANARKDFQHQLLDSKATRIGTYRDVVKARYPVPGSSEHENLVGVVAIFEHAVAEGADKLEKLYEKEKQERFRKLLQRR